MITADKLRSLPKAKALAALKQLTPQQAEELRYSYKFLARPKQIAPEGDWRVWFLNCGRGFGKQVRKDTEILTHNRGWTTVGDLVVGDFVYDEKGNPQEVLAFYESEPDVVYEIEFDTGEIVVADAEHLWTTETHYKNRKRRKGIIPEDWAIDQSNVKTTQEIVDSFTHGSRKDLNHSIPCAKAFVGNKNDLPINPYILGLWLGDGHSGSGCFTNADQDIWDRLAKSFDLTFYADITANAKGFVTELRKLGVFKNKHIPDAYMTSLVEDRLELLRGLMDSDGYIDPDNGCAEFCQNGSNPLADQVFELVCGLGMKASLYTGRATIKGKDCGPKYRVCWTVRDINPFWLPRKAEVANKYLNKTTGQVNRNRQRMLKSFRKVPTPECGLRCLTVTGDSHLFLIGRSFIPTHNTWTGVQWVREQVKAGHKRIAAVAATNSDIERVMVKGDSGFLALCWKGDKNHKGELIGYPLWSPTKRTLTWHKNGDHSQPEIARVEFFSAQEPERLRGPQYSCAWADELAAWAYDQDTWDMLSFCLRLGKKPVVCVTTTPKSTTLVRKLVKDPTTTVTTGTSYENDNLPETFFEKLKEEYEGTRLGRQEIYAEVLTENEGSLWTLDMIDSCQISLDEVPNLVRSIIAVDPAVSANVESDMTGIVHAGIDINGIVYILGDYTMKALPEVWGKRAAELFYEFDCDRLVYESNQGKDMIPPLFRVVDENIPLKGVHASSAKIARAEPVSALYERGKVKHVRNPKDAQASLTELETQMTTYEPMGKHKSPDRYDAMVWAVTELALKGYSAPKLKLAYSNASGLGKNT